MSLNIQKRYLVSFYHCPHFIRHGGLFSKKHKKASSSCTRQSLSYNEDIYRGDDFRSIPISRYHIS